MGIDISRPARHRRARIISFPRMMNTLSLALSVFIEACKAYVAWANRDAQLQTERLTHEIDDLNDEMLALTGDPDPVSLLRIESIRTRRNRKIELLRTLCASGDPPAPPKAIPVQGGAHPIG